jgi:8-oxo-dGTP pyrophosphatase MutT (NUDIX family)
MATEAVARPAATVLLLRQGADGIEVFMVVRHEAIAFASGALVFPGGRVDDHDHGLAADPELCPNPDGLPVAEMAFHVAAIRETFEECGVLLARPRGTDTLVGPEALRTVEAEHRARLAAGHDRFDTVLTRHGLVLATDLLVPFAHWITPAHQPKRYDTRFFVAEAPPQHLAVHDGSESVDSVWITPRQALADTRAGRFKLVFATQMNLVRLGWSATVAQAMEAARATPVVTVQPKFLGMEGSHRRMQIPEAAGYGGSEFLVDNPPAS